MTDTPNWTKTHMPVAAFAKNSCLNPKHDKFFGPKPVVTGKESFTAIAAEAGINLIGNGISAILKAASEASVDTSPVGTSFILSTGEGPRCFEVQKLKKQNSGFAVELGLQLGGTSGGTDKYFRLIPTRLRYKGPHKNLLQKFSGNHRAHAVSAVFSKLDGGAVSSFTLQLGEWSATDTDILLNEAALQGDAIDSSKLEIAGPWFKMPGSAAAEQPFNVLFTLIETKSENVLAGLLSDEFEAQKQDIQSQVTSAIKPTPAPTINERENASVAAQSAITKFCSTYKPILEKAATGTPMARHQIIAYNNALEILKAKLAPTDFTQVTEGIGSLKVPSGNEEAEVNSGKGEWAKHYLASDFNRICG